MFSVEFPFIIITHLVSSRIPSYCCVCFSVFYLVVAQPVRQRSRYDWYILVLVCHFLAAGSERQKLNFNGLLKPLYLIWGLPRSLAPNGCSLIQPQEIKVLCCHPTNLQGAKMFRFSSQMKWRDDITWCHKSATFIFTLNTLNVHINKSKLIIEIPLLLQ